MSFIDDLPTQGGGMLMCIFEATEPGGDMHRMALPLPLPREIESEDGKGKFVLDYQGTFTASYNFVPAQHFDPKFEEWHDFGE